MSGNPTTNVYKALLEGRPLIPRPCWRLLEHFCQACGQRWPGGASPDDRAEHGKWCHEWVSMSTYTCESCFAGGDYRNCQNPVPR